MVTTIHQPSSTIFSKFDKLILLGKGSSLYFGKASEVMVYFSSIGCSPLIAMNPAEFLIDLANGNMKDKSVPSELEDKFLPQSRKKLEPKYAVPTPLDVHEVCNQYSITMVTFFVYKDNRNIQVWKEEFWFEGGQTSRNKLGLVFKFYHIAQYNVVIFWGLILFFFWNLKFMVSMCSNLMGTTTCWIDIH